MPSHSCISRLYHAASVHINGSLKSIWTRTQRHTFIARNFHHEMTAVPFTLCKELEVCPPPDIGCWICQSTGMSQLLVGLLS